MTATPASRWPLLLVACLTVLAGCFGGPTATPTGEAPTASPTGRVDTATLDPGLGTDTPSPCTEGELSAPLSTATPTEPADVSIPVRGEESLPLDVNRTFERTVALLGEHSDVSPPSRINLYRPETPWQPTVTDPFAQTLMDARETTNFTAPRNEGLTMSLSGEESALSLHFTFAHEFAHNAQFKRADETPALQAAFSNSYHRQRVGASVVEGSASYVALQYVLAYTDVDRECVLAHTDQYRRASPAGAYNWAPYHFGRRYVEERVDGPADHWSVYENPPETTEEVIHGLEPGSEPPMNLSVSVAEGEWTTTDRETRGEMFVRVVLTAELPEREAARGAAGWGNDVVVTLERGDRTGYAWAIRWDTPADATEFQGVFSRAMDRRGDRVDGHWRTDDGAVGLVGVTADTVVVVSGPESFVTAVSASGENGTVEVAP